MSDALPPGWVTASLENLAIEIQYGYTAKATTECVGPRYLRITDIQDESVNWNSVPYCEILAEKLPNYLLQAGDLVFARTGATTGKSFLIKTCPEAVFASYLVRVRPAPCLLPEFIGRFFQSAFYWTQISENIAGSAQPNCNASKLGSLQVPIAPLNEQRRIIAKLEALLSKVDSCRKRLDRIPALLKRFRQAVLAAACSGKLTADWRDANAVSYDDDWQELALRELLSEPLANGRSTQTANVGFPVLRLTCLKSGRIDPDKRKIGAWTAKEAVRFLVKKDDFYVARGNGSLGLVGRGGLMEHDPGPVAFPDTMIRVRVKNAVVTTTFLRTVWNSPQVRSQVELAAHTTAGIWKIGQGDMEGFLMSIPPLPEQHEIVRRVEALFNLADQIEARYAKAKAHVDRLSQSILARAFRGELVPQDPNDEPASVMLERISGSRQDKR